MRFENKQREQEWMELKYKTTGGPYEKILNSAEEWSHLMDEGESHAESLLKITDSEDFTTGDVAEMLVLLTAFWSEGGKLLEDLNPIERLLMTENLVHHIARNQGEAALRGQQELENPV